MGGRPRPAASPAQDEMTPQENWKAPSDVEIASAADDLARGVRPKGLGDCVTDIRFADEMAELPDAALRFLFDFWRLRVGPDGGPSRREDFEMLALRPAVGNIMILDVVRGGLDARYRLYGTNIARHAGKDWTGKLVSEMNAHAKTNVALMYRAAYLAVHRLNRPLYTEHRSLPWLGATSWRRVILPVTVSGAGCDQFVVGNVAVDPKPLSKEQSDMHRKILSSDPDDS